MQPCLFSFFFVKRHSKCRYQISVQMDARRKLEHTLSSAPSLTSLHNLEQLVRRQLLDSPPIHMSDEEVQSWNENDLDAVTKKRSAEVWACLEDLRSISQKHTGNKLSKLNGHTESARRWKVKEEDGSMRVLYREGPAGTPFHTYCLEGIINGSTANALSVAWEAPAYKEWWPRYNVPTFKILDSKWIKRIRVGEDLAQIRMRVPWPMDEREAILKLFELEYHEDDLILGIIGTVPNILDEGEKILGYSFEDIPSMDPNVIRVDIAGGFALQKISSTQSYFRTVVSLDLKLDFVPVWFVNFIARQLAGYGYKLYNKAVMTMNTHNGTCQSFWEVATEEPLYHRVKSKFGLHGPSITGKTSKDNKNSATLET